MYEVISLILDGIKEIFKWVFVPSDGYFEDKFTSLRNSLSKKLGFTDFDSFMGYLKVENGEKVDIVDRDGRVIVDFSAWLPYMDRVKGLIRGFYGVMILIFNIKMVLYLIRGSTFINNGVSGEVGLKS